jgi:TPP-dependent pyruvate/acetoin dehydrogenase alpha subunit
MNIKTDQLIDMYKKMSTIRKFEETIVNLYSNRTGDAGGYCVELFGDIPGFVHVYIGEEAVAVGVCCNLRQDDYIVSTHRGHGHLIAKGGDLKLMMAELFSKKTGYCKGKGGSMHIADLDIGILGANGIVGAGLPIATGAGLACKRLYQDRVSVCFFGDGASNRGTFHEALNLASIWKLPVIYICENNGYGNSIATPRHVNIKDIAIRSQSYGIPGESVDGNDIQAVYEVTKRAVARARAGEGPTLIECKTYRIMGHFVGDSCAYVPKGEVEGWRRKDPIKKLEKELIEMGALTPEKIGHIEAKIDNEIEAAVQFARNSEPPALSDALEDVYATRVEVLGR